MSFFIEFKAAAAIMNAHSFLPDVEGRVSDGLKHDFFTKVFVDAFENKLVVAGNRFFQSFRRAADEGSGLPKRIKFFHCSVGKLVLKR